MKKMITLLLVFTGFINWSAHAEMLSEEILNGVKDVKSIVEKSAKEIIASGWQERCEKEYREYHEAVLKLAKLVSPELVKEINAQKEIDINQAIVVMSWNIAKEPERLEELLEYYRFHPEDWMMKVESLMTPEKFAEYKKQNPNFKTEVYVEPHIREPRDLEERHCIETYRHAWEFLLLAPKKEDVGFLFTTYMGHPISALDKIFEVKSSAIMAYIYDVTMVDNKYTSSRYRRKYSCLAFVLKRYMNKNSLHYYLLSNRVNKKENKLMLRAFGLRKPLKTETSAELRFERQKWKKVILAYPKDDLPQWQKEFLDDVLKAIDKQEKKETKATE
jgi:hypothetical protein